MSALYPITASSLLEEVNRLITVIEAERAEKNRLCQAVITDLQTRGYTHELLMIAGDVVDWLYRNKLVPTNPEDGLGIFVGLRGQKELDRISNMHLGIVAARRS